MSDLSLFDSFKEAYDKIAELDLIALRRHDLQDDFRFDRVVDENLRPIQDIFNDVPLNGFRVIPESHLEPIRDALRHFLATSAERIQVFKFSSSNPAEQRNKIISNSQQAFDSLYDLLSRHLGRIALTTNQGLTEKDFEKQYNSFIEDRKNEAQVYKDEFLNTLEALKIATGELAIVQEAEHFEKVRQKHDTASRRWLSGTGVCTFLLIFFALVFPAIGVFQDSVLELFSAEYRTNYSKETVLLNLALAKIFIFASLSFSVFFCSKSYSAHAHNATLNEHRTVALKTYRALVQAAHTPEQRDIILSHAAACIFSPQPTAFVKESAPSSSDIPLLQSITRLVTKDS